MHQKLYGFIKIREFMYRERSRRNGTKKGKEAETENKVDKPFQITFLKGTA